MSSNRYGLHYRGNVLIFASIKFRYFRDFFLSSRNFAHFFLKSEVIVSKREKSQNRKIANIGTRELLIIFDHKVNPLNANPEKWSNTLKQIVGNLPTICLSVFDHFMNLALKGLSAQEILYIFNLFRKHHHKSSVVSKEKS